MKRESTSRFQERRDCAGWFQGCMEFPVSSSGIADDFLHRWFGPASPRPWGDLRGRTGLSALRFGKLDLAWGWVRALSCAWFLVVGATGSAAAPVGGGERPESLRFQPDGKGFRFDTGWLKGRLHADGRSQGLSEVRVFGSTNGISSSMGLFSHYRLLTDRARFGTAAWDWPSEATLLGDGAVEVLWKADEAHPFDMKAIYRWAAPDALDLLTRVTVKEDQRGFEVFLASYFNGFDRSFARVRQAGGESFVEALEKDATWHLFPREESVLTLVRDGRWQREPHPVAWVIRPPLAAPLAMRRDAPTGLVGLVMAGPTDCFALAMPFGAEGHRSIYLCLFGCDLKRGESADSRSRLVLARDLSDEQATARYREFLGRPEVGR